MQLMFQLSLSYYEMLFTDPRNLRLTEADSGRVASIFWIFTLVVKMIGIISSGWFSCKKTTIVKIISLHRRWHIIFDYRVVLPVNHRYLN